MSGRVAGDRGRDRPDPRLPLGRAAESAAEAELVRRGYRILARNVRLAGAEIDLVAEDAGTVAFVEVRSRSSRRHGGPLETIGRTKILRIARASSAFLARHGLSDVPARFDVVGIDWVRGAPVCTLIRGAFESPF